MKRTIIRVLLVIMPLSLAVGLVAAMILIPVDEPAQAFERKSGGAPSFPAGQDSIGAGPSNGGTAELSPKAGGQVLVTGEVRAIRVLVVNEEGDLIQVWSNSDKPALIEVRHGSRSGRKVPLSERLRTAYDQISSNIAPGARGLIYQR